MLLMVLRTSGISVVPNTYKPIMSYKLMLSNATDGAPYLALLSINLYDIIGL